MTVSSTLRKAGPFNGNGVTTAFPFAFKVFAKTDIEVVKTDAAGVQTTLVLDSDYSVALNADQDNSPGGTITYPVSGSLLAAGEQLGAVGSLTYDQGTDITNLGRFLPQVHENVFDRIVMLAQQLLEKFTRAISAPVGDTATSLALPTAMNRANKALVFDASGNVTVSADIAAQAAAAATSAAQAAASLAALMNRYQGAYAADPALRPDGTALQQGDSYFNTTSKLFKVYNGATWQASDINTANLAAATGSSLVGGTWFGGVVATVSQLATSIGAALIGFIQAGVGAVLRSIQDKLRDTVSVKDFGAKLDGVTDDAAALQAAFTFCNGKGLRALVPGASCLIGSSLSLNNFANMSVDWGRCNVTYSGGAGTYLFDMTQAGDIGMFGGNFTGSGSNHLVKTRGSAAAQATTYPTIPADNQWSRRLRFELAQVTGFSKVFDLQNFSREIYIDGNISGNLQAIFITGKVVNLFTLPGSIIYSSLANSNAVVCRGDAGDTAWRYAEGLFFDSKVVDVQGYAFDLQDFYLLEFRGGQIQSPSYAVAVTKGITPLTQNFTFRAQFNGPILVGSGLTSQFLFDGTFEGIFQSIPNTAVGIGAHSKNIRIGGQFDTPSGTPLALSVGAGCVGIDFDATVDAAGYTNVMSIDATSVAGVRANVEGTFTPQLTFGGAATGIAYGSSYGRWQWRGGFITVAMGFLLSSKGTAVGSAAISGLPFAALQPGGGHAHSYNGFNSAVSPMVTVAAGANAVSVKSSGALGSQTILADTDFSNATSMDLVFSYPVS